MSEAIEREAFDKWCNDNHLFDTSNFIQDEAERRAAQECNTTWQAWQAAIQRGRELEREKYKLLFFIDPAALPLSREAEMIYATVSAFDWCTVPVYVDTSVPALRVDQTPVEPEEVYSPHTKVLP